jgi:hypothetical protein
MDRYMGLDAHASSCTLAVVGPSGRRLRSQVVETSARALIEEVRAVAGRRHLCLEEGTLSGWLYARPLCHRVFTPPTYAIATPENRAASRTGGRPIGVVHYPGHRSARPNAAQCGSARQGFRPWLLGFRRLRPERRMVASDSGCTVRGF